MGGGYRYWGPNMARNLAETSGAALRAICDPSAERLALARARHPQARAVNDTGRARSRHPRLRPVRSSRGRLCDRDKQQVLRVVEVLEAATRSRAERGRPVELR